MACDEWKTLLDTYLDGELPEQQQRSFDAHVRNCAACAGDALARVQMKRLVRTAGKSFVASNEFRDRIVGQRRRRPFLAWGIAAVAVLLLAVFSLAYLGQQRSHRGEVFSELADLHVAALASANPVDVVSSDRHTVKPWFEGKIPFSFNLPELQNTDFSLVGGRICYLEQAAGAQLIFRVRKHQISTFIFQDRAVPLGWGTGSKARQQDSFTQQTWDEGGLRYFVVSDTGPDDIDRLSELLKAASKQ